MIIINNWGTKLHTCGGLQSYNKAKGRNISSSYNEYKYKEPHVEEKKREVKGEEKIKPLVTVLHYI